MQSLTRNSARLTKRTVFKLDAIELPQSRLRNAVSTPGPGQVTPMEMSDVEYGTPLSSSSRNPESAAISPSTSPASAPISLPTRSVHPTPPSSRAGLAKSYAQMSLSTDAIATSNRNAPSYETFWAEYQKPLTSRIQSTTTSPASSGVSRKVKARYPPKGLIKEKKRSIPLDLPEVYRRFAVAASQNGYTPRQAFVANEPWYDDPTRELIPRSKSEPHGRYYGFASSQQIDEILQMDITQPTKLQEANSAMLNLMERLICTVFPPSANSR